MADINTLKPNTLFIEVSGSGIPEVDGLFVPSTAPPVKSESGTESSIGYWNGRMAWDRADGKAARSPSLSYSNSYKSWRISRLDGHLAYDMDCDDELPPTNREWHVYKMGVAPAPKLVLHYCDPREPCPKPNVIFILGGPGSGKGTMCELAENQLGWVHLSAGDLLRKERQKGGPTATTIEEIITAGKIVDSEITVTLLKNAMEMCTRTTGKNNFLVDGFPRSLNNLEAWREVFGRDAELPKMLYLECPYDVLEKRTGLPISLAIVYMAIAERCGRPTEGVGFPGHFLVRDVQTGILLDPFGFGRPLQQDELLELLRQQGIEDPEWNEELVASIGKRDILDRLLNNLRNAYQRRLDPERIESVDALAKTLGDVGDEGPGRLVQ